MSTIEIELKIDPNSRIPKKVIKFESWYLDYLIYRKKLKYRDNFERNVLKIANFFIVIAGEATARMIMFYLWLYKKVFGAEPERW